MPSRRRLVATLAGLFLTGVPAVALAAQDVVALDRNELRAATAGDAIAFDRAGVTITARVRRAEASGTGGQVIVADRTDGLGHVIFAVHDDVVVGYVTGTDGTWRALSRGPDEPATFALAADGFSCTVAGAPMVAPPDGNLALAGDCDPQGELHDILVLYEADVETAFGGEEATLAEIDAVMEISNLALENSVTTPRFRLALAWRIDAVGVSLGELADPEDGVVDEVHALRDLTAADQVILLYTGGGGVARGVWELDPAQEANAFCLAGINSFPYVFPHELGHNMGCCHAFGDGGGCPKRGGLLFPFSNGHRWFGDSGTQWRTIMAYAPGMRVTHFSNPLVSFDGPATGTVDADNAQTMDLSLELIGNFRCAEDALCGDLTDPIAREDCNDNGFPDGCDIGSGMSEDVNGNGVPDECEACVGDLDGSGRVDFADVLPILAAWGPCSGCPEDLDGSGEVGFSDVLVVFGAWGPCS